MSSARVFAITTAILGLIGLVALFTAGTPTPLLGRPFEAFQGLAFTAGWLTGVPAWLAYLLSALVFAIVAWICYKLGSAIGRMLSRLA
ncbi:hypothetical protein [Psychrobacter pygoscelis]|uniref:hypothetical protein n=1 Tax=Psychrobacter pygoscelis TaxID=2488563 RepID=UPI00103BB680|nr:hypothetical protein [Psychrobacter pygoscelis]